MIFTTLNRIRERGPCEPGWGTLLTYLNKTKADDEPLAYSTIITSNGADDAIWCCRSEPQHQPIWAQFVITCARRVVLLTTDQPTLDAFDASEKYLRGEITKEELLIPWNPLLEPIPDPARDPSIDELWKAVFDTTIDLQCFMPWVGVWAASKAVTTDNLKSADMTDGWISARDEERKWQGEEFLRIVQDTVV